MDRKQITLDHHLDQSVGTWMEKTGACKCARKMKWKLQNSWACQDNLPCLQSLGAAWQVLGLPLLRAGSHTSVQLGLLQI